MDSSVEFIDAKNSDRMAKNQSLKCPIRHNPQHVTSCRADLRIINARLKIKTFKRPGEKNERCAGRNQLWCWTSRIHSGGQCSICLSQALGPDFKGASLDCRWKRWILWSAQRSKEFAKLQRDIANCFKPAVLIFKKWAHQTKMPGVISGLPNKIGVPKPRWFKYDYLKIFGFEGTVTFIIVANVNTLHKECTIVDLISESILQEHPDFDAFYNTALLRMLMSPPRVCFLLHSIHHPLEVHRTTRP